mmetsp:Transcript_44242/g.139575  ORF Transcript_44242/g.139575 Transcript_44242/m.139575 type:complete len:100 (-) Transcript_44242:187-486(-)
MIGDNSSHADLLQTFSDCSTSYLFVDNQIEILKDFPPVTEAFGVFCGAERIEHNGICIDNYETKCLFSNDFYLRNLIIPILSNQDMLTSKQDMRRLSCL